MTTAERIHILNQSGLQDEVIAAILGVNQADIAANLADPSVAPTPSGGSPFAHLTEEGGYLVADVQVHAPFFGSGDFETFADEFAYLQAGDIEVGGVGSNPVFLAWTAGDAQERFHVRADGSLHLGTGADSPDTHVSHSNADWGSGLVFTDSDANGFFVGPQDGSDFMTQVYQTGVAVYGPEGVARIRLDGGSSRIIFGDDTFADTSLQRAADGSLLLSDPDDDGFYVAAEMDHSTSYVWLGGDGTVAIVNATAQQRNIIVDADGDLAVAGVGKIAIQP